MRTCTHKLIVVVAVLVAVTAATGIGTAFGADARASRAEGTGLRVGDLLTISAAEAGATGDSGSATADVVNVGGSTVVGGSQEGEGEAADALLDTDSAPLASIAIAPWATEVTETSSTRHAESYSAAARVIVIDPNTAVVGVLESHAAADHAGDSSSSAASSDGATVVVGGPSGLRLTVLHSETNSNGTASTSPLGVNETWLVNQSAPSSCVLRLSSSVGVGCLSAEAGLGPSSASVLSIGLVGTDGVTARAQGGSASGASVEARGALVRTGGTGGKGALSSTGGSLAIMALVALTLIIAGTALSSWTRY